MCYLVQYLNLTILTNFMENMIPDNDLATLPEYTLVCTNNTREDQFFYIYQNGGFADPETFPLVWLSSSIVPSRTSAVFTWKNVFSFVYEEKRGLLIGPYCDPELGTSFYRDRNIYGVFNEENGKPFFSDPVMDEKSYDLKIKIAPGVPKDKYCVGISRSGSALFMLDALPETTIRYTLSPYFMIAAGRGMLRGRVLPSYCSLPGEVFSFPSNVYTMYASLYHIAEDRQDWVISDSPF